MRAQSGIVANAMLVAGETEETEEARRGRVRASRYGGGIPPSPCFSPGQAAPRLPRFDWSFAGCLPRAAGFTSDFRQLRQQLVGVLLLLRVCAIRSAALASPIAFSIEVSVP